MDRRVYATPDYLEVRPLGSCGMGGADTVPLSPNLLTDAQVEALKQELLGVLSGSIADINSRMENLKNRLDTNDINDLDLKRILDLTNADIRTLRLRVESARGNGSSDSSNDLLAITTDDAALAQAIQQVNAKFRDMIASYNAIVQSYTSADQALSQKLDQVKAEINGSDIAARVARDVMSQVNNKYALASDVATMRSRFNDVDSKVTEAKQIASSAQGSVANLQRTLTQTVGDYVATHTQGLQSEITRNGRSITDIKRNYTNILTDGSGKVTGFKFGENGSRRDFEINADNFKISNSSQSLTPFEIVGNRIRFTGNVELDQFRQLNTIIRIERYENNSLSPRTVQANFPHNTQACIALVPDAPKSIVFLGHNSYGHFASTIILPANSAALFLYLNQEAVITR